jgi:hypothetical protein
MNAADAWINNNLDAIGILGKTDTARIAFLAGQECGLKEATKRVKETFQVDLMMAKEQA